MARSSRAVMNPLESASFPAGLCSLSMSPQIQSLISIIQGRVCNTGAARGRNANSSPSMLSELRTISCERTPPRLILLDFFVVRPADATDPRRPSTEDHQRGLRSRASGRNPPGTRSLVCCPQLTQAKREQDANGAHTEPHESGRLGDIHEQRGTRFDAHLRGRRNAGAESRGGWLGRSLPRGALRTGLVRAVPQPVKTLWPLGQRSSRSLQGNERADGTARVLGEE